MERIGVILGSTRPARFSERPARWVAEALAARGDLDVEQLDLREYPLPFYEQPAPPARTLREYPDEAIERWGQKIDAADGFVFVTSEYNHGYPAALKNAIDHLFPEWHRKPAAFVGYGNVGGARAIEQLREVVVELEMAPLRHAVHILPDVMVPAMRADDYDASLFESLEPKLQLLADDLAWWTKALAAARVAA
ncbi:MAG TPA: NAD(P)H-dependent oxidoreductase [Thermoleophilaceae bacterium]